MIRHRAPDQVLEDLRFALEVMEENSHLGLDHGAANTLRSRLLRQIAHLEDVIATEDAVPPRAREVLENPE